MLLTDFESGVTILLKSEDGLLLDQEVVEVGNSRKLLRKQLDLLYSTRYAEAIRVDYATDTAPESEHQETFQRKCALTVFLWHSELGAYFILLVYSAISYHVPLLLPVIDSPAESTANQRPLHDKFPLFRTRSSLFHPVL